MTKFPKGVSSFGMPIFGETTGRVFFVDSTSPNKGDDTSHGSEPFTPFATLDFAIGQCTANRGDRVYVLPGHTESVTGAAGINCDVAGVSVIGLGVGRDRPRFTFSTSTAASVDINAASVSIRNLVFDLTGIDNLTTGINAKSNDATIVGCEFIFANVTGQAAAVITSDANANRLRVLDNLFAGSSDAGCVVAIGLNCGSALITEGIEIGWNRIVGNFTTGINILATGGGSFSNLFVHDNTIQTLGSAQAGIIYNGDPAVGSTGVIANNQIAGTIIVSLLVINTSVAPYPAAINNFGYDSDTPNVNGVSIPVVGNQLSTSRSLIDEIIGAEMSYNRANYIAVTADLSSATWNTVAAHEILTVTGAVRVRILPICTSSVTSGGAITGILGTETTTNGMITSTDLTTLDAGMAWLSATPSHLYAKTAVLDFIIANGQDVGYTIGSNAATGGIIVFHVWWEPLNSTGAVVAGAGGVL